ncbi:MAG: NAD(P)/FAD-dependent oxidoreductase [Telluria sp.]
MTTQYDTLIIGGGPGGLAAAIYLRRFLRDVILIDKGNSRLGMVPVTHNFPGFPDGIQGHQLLENLRCQLGKYGGTVTQGEVTSLRRDGDGFSGAYDGGELRARTVLMATGIADAGLPIEDWRAAVAAGAVRLCPVCDGFDVLDKHIAIVSSPDDPVDHALFMRTFSASVTLFERGRETAMPADQRERLHAAGVRYIVSPVLGVSMSHAMTPVIHTEDGESHPADVLYPILGETARSDLAVSLGARTDDCRELEVDAFQCTSVPGLYAIGDVVKD